MKEWVAEQNEIENIITRDYIVAGSNTLRFELLPDWEVIVL